jgi:opacity protein-like surface antigen
LNISPKSEIFVAPEDPKMKRFLAFTTMLAALSVPALAAKNSQTVAVPMPVKVGSAQLNSGNYDVAWTGTGSDVQVTVSQNHKLVTTFPAKLIEETNKNVGLETQTQSGVDVLHAIRMKNTTLIVGNSPSSGQ